MLELASLGKIEMTTEEVNDLFGTSTMILSINEQIVQDLHKRLSSWIYDVSTVSDILCNLGPFLRMYKTYSVTVRDSVQRISEVDAKKQPLFSTYLEEKRNSKVCRGLDFGTFLTTSIKRIPRYLLLLRELRKLTSSVGHPEIVHLDKAERLLSAVAEDINKAILDKDNGLKLVHINNLLYEKSGVQLVEPGREYISEFECHLLEMTKRKTVSKKSKLYLFNDLILLASKDNKMKFCYKIVDILVQDVQNTSKQSNLVEFIIGGEGGDGGGSSSSSDVQHLISLTNDQDKAKLLETLALLKDKNKR
eukprot:TRINITY_DN6637_c0_g1_i8.p1 TRINITY_DN6637_c0_g1~~TRINITY_DN6637_c0_g1_i8.p1  ORF type:complete len:306 (+),score=84.47 TRINITY_DN6637_c0_g1_i8:705-1622(+)